MRIRAGTVADTDAIAKLVGALGYAADLDDLRPRLAELMASERDAVLVADADGVLGFVTVSMTPMPIAPGRLGRITALCVDPGHRRGGVGAALLAAAEAWAVHHGCTLLQVNSGRRPERDAAHAFYPALGYRDQHDHHVLYEKRLT